MTYSNQTQGTSFKVLPPPNNKTVSMNSYEDADINISIADGINITSKEEIEIAIYDLSGNRIYYTDAQSSKLINVNNDNNIFISRGVY